ncbi:uncharacterized protein TNCV_3507171 [Trichonephila clavipes]|uniref:Uncharacterized protein n=1 Tax=Trichonephila clavipes TaxID=2585209 RepID=A0A8X6RVZ1_TRICX|nr:uncharacterized protein TNCV_3507171 [Trichonephila clavipes]
MHVVETKIRKIRRLKITILSLEFTEVSRSVMYNILTEDIDFKKLCSLWVPRLLTVEHKQKRVAISLHFLILYEEERDAMLSRIIAGDETGESHITPELKQQSLEWRHTSSLVKIKAKKMLPKPKIMATVF